jgi:hypothetical protein
MKAILTAGKEICVLEREIRDCTRATQVRSGHDFTMFAS